MPQPTTIRDREMISSERTLAEVRLVLSLASMVVGATLVGEGIASPYTLFPILGAFTAYSLLLRLLAVYRPATVRVCAVGSSFVDVVWITALNYVTESAHTAQNPFYLWYVFYVVSVSVRYGLNHAILALSASIVLYTGASYMASKLPQSVLPGFLARTGFLFILAFLFGHMSERYLNYQARIAVVHDLGIGLSELSTASDIVSRLLKETAEVLSAERCWFVPWAAGRSVGLSPAASDPADLERIRKSRLLREMGEWSPEKVLDGQRVLAAAGASQLPAQLKGLAADLKLHSAAAVPMYAREGPVGVLYVFNPVQGRFTSSTRELLELIAAQAAPLIENARLWEKMREAATMEERLRIARDLHDNFLQTLAGIRLHLEHCGIIAEQEPAKLKDALNRVHEIAAAGLQETRAYLSRLRLMGPDPAKFADAARATVQEAASRGGFLVHPEIDLPSEPVLSEDCAVAAYMILRELLNNVVLHARADNVWVRIRMQDGRLQLTVRDDGIGFDPRLAEHQSLARGHLGLIGAGERARGVGGELTLTSTPGSGAIATVTLPCGEPQQRADGGGPATKRSADA